MCYEVSETRAGRATRSKERRGGQGGVADVAAGRRAGPCAVCTATTVLPVGGHNRAAAAASARPPLQRPARCPVGSRTREPNPEPGKQPATRACRPRLERPPRARVWPTASHSLAVAHTSNAGWPQLMLLHHLVPALGQSAGAEAGRVLRGCPQLHAWCAGRAREQSARCGAMTEPTRASSTSTPAGAAAVSLARGLP